MSNGSEHIPVHTGTDYEAMIHEARGAQRAVYLAAPKPVAADLSRIIQGLADAVEALVVERDALRAQPDGTCSHPFSRLKFDGGRRALVCNSCDRIVTHLVAVEEGDDQ